METGRANQMLCDNLEGWDGVGGGKFKKDDTCVYLWLIHVFVWQNPTQHCKATIFQLKINKFQNRKEKKYSGRKNNTRVNQNSITLERWSELNPCQVFTKHYGVTTVMSLSSWVFVPQWQDKRVKRLQSRDMGTWWAMGWGSQAHV